MSDLIDDPRPGENAHEYTVSEISGAVKRSLEAEFGRIRVKGEVGRVVKARSGHMYFDVKDDRNTLACTTWKGQVSRLTVVPEEGMEVVVTGKMTSFGGQSKYNLNVDDVTVAGVGALMAMLEKRKTALAAEGLFAASRKQQIPFLPEIIGVVTSPTGAVIRDILHRLRDRFPRKVLVWPVAVQGTNCAPQVASAIDGFNAMSPGGALPRPDLIIVARGGGSIEDLWGFNEEVVARAAAASQIPLISAVGHETDTTLIDFVSDQRAPTPTAAAELAVPVRLDLLAWTETMGARGAQALANGQARKSQRLADLARALPRVDSLLQPSQQKLDVWDERLPNALRAAVQVKKVKLVEASVAVRPAALTRLLTSERQKIGQIGNRLSPSLQRATDRLARDFQSVTARLRPQQFETLVTAQRTRLAEVGQRMNLAAARNITQKSDKLTATDRVRETLGYRETLRRGFAVVRSEGQVITSAAKAKGAAALHIEFEDGVHKVASKAVGPTRKATLDPDQGQLL
ncbi:MAG: exodeoxyribonuclease VII large subunit [Planktomarina sp.]